MRLREFFSEDAIKLDLESTAKDAVLKKLVGLLKLDDKAQGLLFKMLKRRETLGSTGIGQHISIPHCRSLVVTRLRCAFGRSAKGVDFKAIDDQPVNYFFLIVAPRSEEHTSELQSQSNLVCRLLLEKKKKKQNNSITSIHSNISEAPQR